MKRKRGRPPGKKFPQPKTIIEGMWNADFGKVGVSEAMHVVMGCPYRESPWIEGLPQRRRFFKKWNAEAGQLIGEKIATRDHAFFQDLATAMETLNKNEEPHSIERLMALEHKLNCELSHQPFTFKGLRAYYRRHGKEKMAEDSSKVSKHFRWAKSAKWRKLPYLPAVRKSVQKMPF